MYWKTSVDRVSRFSKHKSDVNTMKDKAVPNHFNLPGHSSSDMRFLPFEVIKGGGDATLLASREQYGIDKKKLFKWHQQTEVMLSTSLPLCSLNHIIIQSVESHLELPPTVCIF